MNGRSDYQKLFFFSVGIGLAFGMASVLWIGFIFNDTVIEITLTLAVSYIAYFAVCYFLASNYADVFCFENSLIRSFVLICLHYGYLLLENLIVPFLVIS